MQRLVFVCIIPLLVIAQECTIARDSGDSSCGKPKQAFYYDKLTKRCQPFFYKGCNGNGNRFDSRQQCQDACADAKFPDDTSNAVCASGAFAAGATSGKPMPCSACPNGYKCENDLCCPTKAYTCNLQYDAGKFGSSGTHTPRYFFSKSYGNCMLFTFFGRDGNANNFATYNECEKFCK